MSMRKKLGLILGPVIFIFFLLIPAPEGMNPLGMRAVAVAFLMAIFWVTEAISIFATSFLPLALYPLLGILDSKQLAASYGHHIVILILGAFFVAKAIESNNLHKRIALFTIKLIGTSRSSIIFSFMIATGFLSMWTSNNSTTLMMLPIGLAIIYRERDLGADISGFAPALMLGIAYSASIGGTGTLVGTPPNLIFVSTVQEIFPESPPILFTDWLKIGIPFVIVFLPIACLYLVKIFKVSGSLYGDSNVIDMEYNKLGLMSSAEKKVTVIVLFYALGFIFRNQWSEFIGVGNYVKDSTVAILAAVILFSFPSGKQNEIGKKLRLLEWEDAKTIPWGIGMLIGGGLAIASSFKASGLIFWIGNNLNLEGIPSLIILFLIVTFMVFLTEINSNAASTAIFLPILAGISKAGGYHPFLLMVPATIAASCAFMLPSGTGPNASILASGQLKIPQMAKAGFGLNLIAILLIIILTYTVIMPSLDI